MKNSNLIINIIFGFAIALLFILNANKKNTETNSSDEPKNPVQITTTDSAGNVVVKTFPVAYVILDSLMQNYEYYKKIEKEYQALMKREESILQQKAQAFQQEVATFQDQAQKGLITTRQGEAKQLELGQKQQSLMDLQQSKEQELALKEQSLMKELLDSVHATLNIYNADGRFEIILNNAFNSSILHANEQLNITDDILKILNARYSEPKK